MLKKAGVKHGFKKKFWNFGSFFLRSVANATVGMLTVYYGYCPAQMARDVIEGRL